MPGWSHVRPWFREEGEVPLTHGPGCQRHGGQKRWRVLLWLLGLAYVHREEWALAQERRGGNLPLGPEQKGQEGWACVEGWVCRPEQRKRSSLFFIFFSILLFLLNFIFKSTFKFSLKFFELWSNPHSIMKQILQNECTIMLLNSLDKF